MAKKKKKKSVRITNIKVEAVEILDKDRKVLLTLYPPGTYAKKDGK